MILGWRKPVLFLVALAVLGACRGGVPDRSNANYPAAIRSFYVGLAAMQVADDIRARTELENAVKLADGEPAAWANLGILQMRQKDFPAALKSLERARGLAPDNGRIYANLAVLQTQLGNFDEVRKNLERSIAADANDAKPVFALAEELERQGDEAGALERYEAAQKLRPENAAVALELTRLAAKRGDGPRLASAFAVINPRRDDWDEEVRKQYATLDAGVKANDFREVTRQIAFFRNVLLRVPEFRAAIDEVKFSKTTIGEPFSRPLRIAAPDFRPAPPDTGLGFSAERLNDKPSAFAAIVFPNGDDPPVAAFSSGSETKVGDAALGFPARDAVNIDLDYDFRNDLVIAGPNGLRFFGADRNDISAATKLPKELLDRPYSRVFTLDVEIDGDLDIIAVTDDGEPVTLRNNADGTFKQLSLFGDAKGATDFVAIDIDEDGDIDAAFVAGGKLVVFSNERGGQFRRREPPLQDEVTAIASGDLNGDGRLDLNILTANGTLVRAEDRDGRAWQTTTLIETAETGPRRLIVQDLDNNGAADVVAGGRVWLTDGAGALRESDRKLDGNALAAADLNGDGRIDLVGTGADGAAVRFINKGSKNYGWQIIRPRSAKADGDQRVNSFGIGGEMEIRAGLLAQKRPISSPQVHFGLGEQPSTDLLRVIWGNGFIQAEFELARDQQILVKQRLTGSCPHLFAWNGSEFALVKDAAPLATSLGLKVSDSETLPVTQTEEWYKIPGSALAEKDGAYEIRITDELWEAYYIDHYSLLAVDHPAGTEVHANELYPVPTPLRLHVTAAASPFAAAADESGKDVLGMIAERDGIYLDTFADGRFQGVAREHFVELAIPDDAPRTPLKIIADGWLHPTDTSLNVAISQSGFDRPRGISLDVAGDDGQWRTLGGDLGVPAGKLKTVVFDLPAGTKRARLRTNSEVFWDRLAWAAAIPDDGLSFAQVELSDAELLHRGYSVIEKANDSSPEIPDYERIATTIERWRSIEGYYTRYGPIGELLARTDDRYAIVASGDEMRLRFRALPPVRAGFVRDFIFVGVGWIKEGDYNNRFSRTVLPLPTHADSDYSRPPASLEDDPVFQRNRRDWEDFHTRYVAPDSFRNAVRK